MRRARAGFWASGTMLPLRATRRPDGFLTTLPDATEAWAEAEPRALLMTEMAHRIRNTFVIVQAVAALTRRHSPGSADLQAVFDARLGVLAHSHNVLLRADWDDAPLRSLIEGASVMLATSHAVTASLAFHELATNAVKRGALSVSQGRVAVTWSVVGIGHGPDWADILWREPGGPTVQPPLTRRSFGSHLLERGLPPGGSVRLDFGPDGLECRLVPAPHGQCSDS